MKIVVHRINTIGQLEKIKHQYGVEVDIRANGGELILNHSAFEGGERFVDYLEHYNHGLMVINIKEAGIETDVLKLVRRKGVGRFFLLDVEFPYIYQASRAGERAIAMRYSEDESIETVLNYAGRVDWVWIDTITKLPLDKDIVEKLRAFHTCLVCPERWGHPEDILLYAEQMKNLRFWPDAVMTASDYIAHWEKVAKEL